MNSRVINWTVAREPCSLRDYVPVPSFRDLAVYGARGFRCWTLPDFACVHRTVHFYVLCMARVLRRKTSTVHSANFFVYLCLAWCHHPIVLFVQWSLYSVFGLKTCVLTRTACMLHSTLSYCIKVAPPCEGKREVCNLDCVQTHLCKNRLRAVMPALTEHRWCHLVARLRTVPQSSGDVSNEKIIFLPTWWWAFLKKYYKSTLIKLGA